MQGLIVNKLKGRYFTNMKEILDAIDLDESKYNWLISDYECNVYPAKEIPPDGQYVWIDGESLLRLFDVHEIQFIWAVFSAFPKNIDLNKILTHPMPFANGNCDLWNEKIKMQNHMAAVEIISWDSSLVIIVSQLSSVIQRVRLEYPEAVDLHKYNS